MGAWAVCLACRWSGLWVACVWLAACGLLGLVRCGLCGAARWGAGAGVLLVVFCLLRLWRRWLCRWCWRWLPALGGRCVVSLLGLGRCPRCRSVVVWLAGLLLGLLVPLAVGGVWRRCVFWLARGLWSLACGACGCGCLCWPSFWLLSRLLLASSVGGLRACSLVLVSWFWLFCAVCVCCCAGLWLCVLFLFASWVRGSTHWVARRAVVADEK